MPENEGAMLPVSERGYYITVCAGCAMRRNNDGVCPECRHPSRRVIEVVPVAEVERLREQTKVACRQAIELDHEVERLREALERIYETGRGPHVGIAKEALDA